MIGFFSFYIKPNIINGFDFSLTFLEWILVDEDEGTFFPLYLSIRFEKGLFTTIIKLYGSLAHWFK